MWLERLSKSQLGLIYNTQKRECQKLEQYAGSKLRKFKVQVHFGEGIGLISNHRHTVYYTICLLLW